MKIRIIIPVFNPPPCFFDTLTSLEEEEPSLCRDVIVVDDGSTNGIGDKIASDYPEITVLRGDGNLWWAGGMKTGMQYALEAGADVIVWLNHDCVPDKGTIQALAVAAAEPHTGAVSAWCRTRGYEDSRVNPGFIKFKPIPVSLLSGQKKTRVDGVNGNCVAMNALAVREIGLPDTSRHPHYGDGPYAWRLHRAGFHNFVLPSVSATLSRELERCIDERSHSLVWKAHFLKKIAYYLLSPRSKYHWKNKFHDIRVFRGKLKGLLYYPSAQIMLISRVASGHMVGKFTKNEDLIETIISRYRNSLPEKGLRSALEALSKRNV